MRDTPITCNIFLEGERAIKVLTKEINSAPAGQPKVLKAEELLKEVEGLLGCQKYDPTSLECQSCRRVANLRKQTAQLVLKVHGSIGRRKS